MTEAACASETVSGTTSELTWDRSPALPLLLSDGQNSYIYGPGGIPIEQISSGEAPTYYHHDQLGSTRMLTNSSGESTGSFTYGAYGALAATAGLRLRHRATRASTQAPKAGSNIYVPAYDPATTQFMSRDPLLELTGAPYAEQLTWGMMGVLKWLMSSGETPS